MISIINYLMESIAANATSKVMQYSRDIDDNIEGLVREIYPNVADKVNKVRQIGYRFNQATGGNLIARATGASQLPPPDKSSK